jgi:transcriptional regulator with XRE-family HTH domain
MTPFGAKLRELRQSRSLTQKQMAAALNVSAAYLSALEHGHRAAPSFDFVQRVTGYFNVIWDEAEELQRLAAISNPKVIIDTSGLAPEATELANQLARRIASMTKEQLEALLESVKLPRP